MPVNVSIIEVGRAELYTRVLYFVQWNIGATALAGGGGPNDGSSKPEQATLPTLAHGESTRAGLLPSTASSTKF